MSLHEFTFLETTSPRQHHEKWHQRPAGLKKTHEDEISHAQTLYKCNLDARSRTAKQRPGVDSFFSASVGMDIISTLVTNGIYLRASMELTVLYHYATQLMCSKLETSIWLPLRTASWQNRESTSHKCLRKEKRYKEIIIKPVSLLSILFPFPTRKHLPHQPHKVRHYHGFRTEFWQSFCSKWIQVFIALPRPNSLPTTTAARASDPSPLTWANNQGSNASAAELGVKDSLHAIPEPILTRTRTIPPSTGRKALLYL